MTFSETVYMIVRQIPKGKVATYKQIAILTGKPSAFRAVGNALHNNKYPIIIPCHRVVNSKGRLSDNFAYGGSDNQKALLLDEGVTFIDEKTVNLSLHKWDYTFYSFEKSTRS